MPKVLNKRTNVIPPEAIYVGRPSKWGNPITFVELRALFPNDTTKELHRKAVERYENYLRKEHRAHGSESIISQAKKELKGKDLVCWCAPLPCHADVLLELANR